MMGYLLFTTTPMCRDSDWLGESVSQSPGVSHEPAGVTPGNPAAVPAVLSWPTAEQEVRMATLHCRTAFRS